MTQGQEHPGLLWVALLVGGSLGTLGVALWITPNAHTELEWPLCPPRWLQQLPQATAPLELSEGGM